MAETQLKTMKPKHQLLAQYMLVNPGTTQGELAVEFSMTQSWVSIIVNSHAFAEYMAMLNETLLQEQVIPLRDKLLGVSHRAVEKLGDCVDKSSDPRFILDAADKTLHRLGYAPRSGTDGGNNITHIQQNVFMADKDLLAEARSTMLRQAEGGSERESESHLLPEGTFVNNDDILENTSIVVSNIDEDSRAPGPAQGDKELDLDAFAMSTAEAV